MSDDNAPPLPQLAPSAGSYAVATTVARPAEAGLLARARATIRTLAAREAVRACLGLVLLCLAVYAGVAHYPFVNYDDPPYVTQNAVVRSGLNSESVAWALTTGYFAYWHPLTWLSLMADAELYGSWAGGFHLTNLFLHIAAALALFAALYEGTRAAGRSFVVAALFAIHPAHVETVAWVAERKGVLSTLFFMLALWAYARYARRPRPLPYLAAAFFFACGLMSKPMVVTLPCVLLLLDLWPLGRWPLEPGRAGAWAVARRLVLEKLPFFALAALGSYITTQVVGGQGNIISLQEFPLGGRAAYAAISYISYLGTAIWPSGLAPFYPFRTVLYGWRIVASVVILVTLTWAALRAAKSRPHLTVGWLWFIGTLVPVIGLVQSPGQTMTDRYTYLPFVGLFVAAAWGAPDLLAGLRRRNLALGLVAAGVLIGSALAARAQVGHWSSNVALWSHALAVTGENHVNCNNYGAALTGRDRQEEARVYYLKALYHQPDFAEARFNLGNAWLGMNKAARAIPQLRVAVRQLPDNAPAHASLGLALATQGKEKEAASYYTQAIRLDPALPEPRLGLGVLLAKSGRTGEAIRELAGALRLKPGSVDAHYNLGVALATRGRRQESLRHLEAALRLDPGHVPAREAIEERQRAGAQAADRRGGALWKQGRHAQAAAEFSRAVKADAGSAQARGNLGLALASQGRLEEAVAEYRKALRLDPGFAEARSNLGIALQRLGKADEALDEFRLAVRLKPAYAEARANLGIALAQRGELEEALKELSEARRLAPGSAEVRFNFAVMLHKLGKDEAAVVELLNALEREPGHGPARTLLERLKRERARP